MSACDSLASESKDSQVYTKDNDGSNSENSALEVLRQFLQECDQLGDEQPRLPCPSCAALRSMYCYDCCEIVIPRQQWPMDEIKGLELPCAVDIILGDRRASATGVHAACILQGHNAMTDSKKQLEYQLVDQSKGDSIPDYSAQEGVYCLFPCANSTSLSSVAHQVRRLVVLDCKWTKSHVREDDRIRQLPRVHLDNPPQGSFYWRWHNSGSGMLSSIEALYFALWQVAEARGWSVEQRANMVHLLWIFGAQRAVIQRKYEIGKVQSINPYVPFSEEAKEFARKLRRRDKERKNHQATLTQSEC